MINNLVLIFSRLCLLFSFTFHFWITISPFMKSTISSSQDERLVMKLVHRDSVISPIYSKSSTISDRVDFIMKSSMARLSNLKVKTNGAFIPYIEGMLVPNSHATVFYLNVSVGEPSVPQLLLIDTASDLLWIQCKPCSTCSKTVKPKYDPKYSFSYAPISCYPKDCRNIFRGHCNSNKECVYFIAYRDGTNSSGIVAYEKFVFNTYNRGTVVAKSVVFGCGTKHNDQLPDSNGVFGLSADKASAISSIGSRFSYCIGSINDPHYPYNFLIMGDGAVIEGYVTPFEIRHGLYYVTLEGITVNQTNITANPKEFKFNIAVDSGSTMTFLARSLYEPLKVEVKKIMDTSYPSLQPRKFRSHPDLLCYKGSMDQAVNFPPVTLHFADGLDIALDGETLFFGAKEAFCMAINAQDDGMNLLGVIAQQYSNIGFDLEANIISYRPADCAFVA